MSISPFDLPPGMGRAPPPSPLAGLARRGNGCKRCRTGDLSPIRRDRPHVAIDATTLVAARHSSRRHEELRCEPWLSCSIGLLGSDSVTDYSRSLGSKELDQPALDAEGYGEKKTFKREDDGLRITLAPGEPETGWKTPPQLRFGGNFTISANFVIKKLPKPAQEDGAAIGLAIAFQDPNQPDVTLVRVLEPNGSDVYRSIEKAGGNPMQMQMQMQMNMRMMMMMGPATRRQAAQAAASHVSGRGRRGSHGACRGRAIPFASRWSTPSRLNRAISARLSLGPTM